MTRPWIYLCFFLSGFSGLVNEVVWSRLFVYTLGSSNLSITVAVSVFMGGLALGSLIGGRIADRAGSPLRLYGLLVAGAGLLSALVVPLLWLAEPLVGLLYRLHDGEPGHPLFTATRVGVCALTILAPSTFMGATLPALARHLTRDLGEIGSRLGALYAVNTFGAVAGALAAGFLLIRWIGLGWSLGLGALVDLSVGTAVLLLAPRPAAAAAAASGAASIRPRKEAPATAPGPGPVPGAAPGPDRGRAPISANTALVAFGISGFVNMALQLGWTRALIISIGNSTYAFTVIVSIFIFGLAAGGWIAGLFADRLRRPEAAFGWLLLAIAAAAGSAIPWLGMTPARFAWDLGQLMHQNQLGFTRFLFAAAGSVALSILPATLLMGMTFPLAGRVQALARPGIGRAVGAAYGANTIGAILGTAITGFILIPLLGRIWVLLYLAVGLGGAAGLAVLAAAPGERRLPRWAAAGALSAILLALAWITRPAGVLDSPEDRRTLWHPVIYSQGSYRSYLYAMQLDSRQKYVDSLLASFDAVYYRDGESASVAVLKQKEDGLLSLNIAGKTDASAGPGSLDHSTQLLLGHLPLLAHPAPEHALTLGLGGGMTLGAMTLYSDLKSIDLLEISPEVEEAARRFFSSANHAALQDERVRAIIGDGRNHIAHTDALYDVISSEPSNFWIAGLGNLFTKEFYRLALDRLKPGGIMCQWIYSYSIRPQDYRTALRTFLGAFPHAAIWTDGRNDTILLGSREPIVYRRERIAAAFAQPAAAELAALGIRKPEDLFRYYLCDGAALRGWVGDGPTNRDLLPVLEFSSPWGYFQSHAGILLEMEKATRNESPAGSLQGFLPAQIEAAAGRSRLGRSMLRLIDRLYEYDYKGAVEEYRQVVKAGDVWAIDAAAHELFRDLSTAGEKGVPFIRPAREAQDTPELAMLDNYIYPPGTKVSSLLPAYREFNQKAAPVRWQPYFALGQMHAITRMFPEALRYIDEAKERGTPEYQDAHVRGVILNFMDDLEGSEAALRRALARIPPGKDGEKGEIHYNLGDCLEKQGEVEQAIAAYRQALALGSDPVRGGVAVARCLRKRGHLALALETAKRTVEAADGAKRDASEARAEAARALAASGQAAEALPWLEEAAKGSPERYRTELEEMRRAAGGQR